MQYDYVRRAYGVDPKMGARVRHTVTGNFGKIARENLSAGHYVQVRFDGSTHALPCHPTELDYSPAETAVGSAQLTRDA